MRSFLSVLLVTTFVPAITAQDTEFIRALERAQTERPATLTSVARIAPEGEPGMPLAIRGKVFADDAKTPVSGAIVFAYHTDRTGLYDKAGTPAHSWRLKGWARTGTDGGFEFRTMRPGSYPGNRIPAHVHFTVFTSDARYHAGELRFDDDKLVPADERTASTREGMFGGVRPVRQDGGTQHVDFSIRLKPQDRF